MQLAIRVAQGEKIEKKHLKDALLSAETAADIAMFGRMMSGIEKLTVEAAVQVGHAFTTHKAEIESDVFAAIDDFPKEEAGAGAAHFDSTGVGFGSGVFYIYVCINRELLIENLKGNEGLARDAIGAFTRGLATVSPTGKQASFASRTRAAYILAEHGDDQPRQLSGAFLKPVRGEDLMAASIAVLTDYRQRIQKAYGDVPDTPENTAVMNLHDGTGLLADILAFVAR